jgi:Ulp1 family protease
MYKSSKKLVDYPGPPCTAQVEGTPKPIESPQHILLWNALTPNATKKRRRVKHDGCDVRASTYTQNVEKEEIIIHASVDVKHRLKAHLVLRSSVLPDSLLGEIVTRANIFVTGGAYDITMGDIHGLNQGEFVNDAIIDIVMAGIQREARVRNGLKADLYVTTMFYSMLLFSDNSAARKLTTKLKVDEGDRLFTIVNTRSGSHWVAVEINFKKKIVTIMDSLRPKQGGAYYVELEMIGKRLQTWADTEAKLVHEGKGGPVSTLASLSCNLPWMFELCKVCPQQTNGYDCGLFALATVAARSRGATKHNVPDMKEQRIFLAAWIVSLHNNHVE